MTQDRQEATEQSLLEKLAELVLSFCLIVAPVTLAFAGGLHYGKTGFGVGLGVGLCLMLGGFKWAEGRDFYVG